MAAAPPSNIADAAAARREADGGPGDGRAALPLASVGVPLLELILDGGRAPQA